MKAAEMNKLKEPFPESDIEWRLQSCGKNNGKFWAKPLAYITSRAVQERLDAVCGTDGWQSSITKQGDAYLCTLSIRVEHDDGSTEWISRTDGADSTDIEAVKGGISGAIKRSAVLFGVGRYLYNLKDGWAEISDNGKFNGKTKENERFRWNPPKLPAWALPKVNAGSVPALEVPSQEKIEKLKQSLLDWINTGIITGKWLDKANSYISSNDAEGMIRTIEWCKSAAQNQQPA